MHLEEARRKMKRRKGRKKKGERKRKSDGIKLVVACKGRK